MPRLLSIQSGAAGSTTTLVVGASIAGVRTVQALRSAGYPGEVVLIGEEPHLPYDKPPLSKAILSGAVDANDILLLTEQEAHAAGVRLLLGKRAKRLDVAEATLEIVGGERLEYDDIVIATGSRARLSPWGGRSGVHVLRTLADAEELRADLQPRGHLVVVGAGFIGCEVAATARSLGLDVSLVDPMPAPMGRVLGEEVGAIFATLHRRHGVATHFGVGVESIEGERGTLRVELTNGAALDATVVVVGIGATPNDDWLESSGLLIDNGVVCDEHGRAVDAAQVYAVGDVARWWNPRSGEWVRLEHWTNAIEQAGVVAYNITHPDKLRSHASEEYVWSDQFDWKIQIVGRTVGRDWEVIGDPGSSRFSVLYGNEREPLAGLIAVNWPRALIAGRRALAADSPLEEVRAALGQVSAPRS